MVAMDMEPAHQAKALQTLELAVAALVLVVVRGVMEGTVALVL
jgi:hypothetical protein